MTWGGNVGRIGNKIPGQARDDVERMVHDDVERMVHDDVGRKV